MTIPADRVGLAVGSGKKNIREAFDQFGVTYVILHKL